MQDVQDIQMVAKTRYAHETGIFRDQHNDVFIHLDLSDCQSRYTSKTKKKKKKKETIFTPLPLHSCSLRAIMARQKCLTCILSSVQASPVQSWSHHSDPLVPYPLPLPLTRN